MCAPPDAVIVRDGVRELVTMRWGLVPGWWSKPLKELKMATFNARADRAGGPVASRPDLDLGRPSPTHHFP
jgi:putative SOS response-associated peptidase YedK